MKHLKILGLLAVAAAAMMAFAASASADYLSTTTGGAEASPTIHAVNENGHVSLHNPEANIECASTTSGAPNTQGAGESISGPISSLSFTGCTNGWTVTVNAAGSLTTVANNKNHGGTLSSSGSTVTATLNLFFFHITCRYATNNTSIGTITGGNPATLHIEGKIPFHSGSAACGEEPSQWTGDYVTTSAVFVNDN
jgi:hypothetical protein